MMLKILEYLGFFSLIFISIGLFYYFFGIVLGLKQSKLDQKRLILDRVLSTVDIDRDYSNYHYFVIVPCLNEELVIEKTITELSKQANQSLIHIDCLVVDDNSDDKTVEIAKACAKNLQSDFFNVEVFEKPEKISRMGKGHSLNYVFNKIKTKEIVINANKKFIIAVFDADGYVSEGAFKEVAKLFNDENVGGVQLPVRISNTGKYLTDFQDYEFWGVSALPQVARSSIGTSSLGGNAQFATLDALLSLEGDPWTKSLTEDLDLSISMMEKGWLLRSTSNAYVWQQAVTTIKQFFIQRTRWMQGHIVCSFRINTLREKSKLTPVQFGEVAMYLLSPVLMVIPWFILYNLSFFGLFAWATSTPSFTIFGSLAVAKTSMILSWLVLSLFPIFINSYLYSRRSQRNILYAFCVACFSFVSVYIIFFCIINAIRRILLNKKEWQKTKRKEA